MHPLQLLHIIPHVLDAGPKSLTNVLLRIFVQIQEPLQHLTVDEAPGALAFTLRVPKRPVRIESEAAGGLDHICEFGLEAEKQVLCM